MGDARPPGDCPRYGQNPLPRPRSHAPPVCWSHGVAVVEQDGGGEWIIIGIFPAAPAAPEPEEVSAMVGGDPEVGGLADAPRHPADQPPPRPRPPTRARSHGPGARESRPCSGIVEEGGAHRQGLPPRPRQLRSRRRSRRYSAAGDPDGQDPSPPPSAPPVPESRGRGAERRRGGAHRQGLPRLARRPRSRRGARRYSDSPDSQALPPRPSSRAPGCRE